MSSNLLLSESGVLHVHKQSFGKNNSPKILSFGFVILNTRIIGSSRMNTKIIFQF